MISEESVTLDRPSTTEAWEGIPPSETTPEAATLMEGTEAALGVLLLHEDLPTALRAKRVMDRVKAATLTEVRIVLNPWRPERLCNPLLRSLAMDDVRNSAILFLSMHGGHGFPPAFRTCLHAWLAARETRPGAVVLSLDADMEGSLLAHSALDYVRSVAGPSEFEVFPHFSESPPLRSDSPPSGFGPEAGTVAQSALRVRFRRHCA